VPIAAVPAEETEELEEFEALVAPEDFLEDEEEEDVEAEAEEEEVTGELARAAASPDTLQRRRWRFMEPRCRNLVPHLLHSKGITPVWMRLCEVSVPFCLKLLPHVSHLNGVSPVWMRV